MALGSAKVFCLVMIIIGILAVLAGSAAPFWLNSATGLANYGLWYLCLYDECGLYSWGKSNYVSISLWFIAVHGAAGLATLLGLVLLFVSLHKICANSDSATGTGVMALFCGLLGIGAGLVFFFKPIVSTLIAYITFSGYRGWAFFVFSGGSAVITLFSIILLVLPNPQNNAVRPF